MDQGSATLSSRSPRQSKTGVRASLKAACREEGRPNAWRVGGAEGRRRGTGRWTAAVIPVQLGVRVWIATGHTDMRRGMNSLALLVQEAFRRDPHGGDLYVFRGKSGKLIKIVWHDGLGMSLYAKRL